jgi:hypothetical protein
MSYFDPKIYNKQNLRAKDLKEMEFWKSHFEDAVQGALDTYECEATDGKSMVAKMQMEIVENFVKVLKEQYAMVMQECTVAFIDDYEEDVPLQEDPRTWFEDEDVDSEGN